MRSPGFNQSDYFTLAAWYSTSTDALDEGSNNLYWTDARFDTRLAATTTLSNLQVLTGLTDLIATNATATNFSINGDSFDDLTGVGLVNTAGTLAVDTSYLDPRYASTTDFDTSAELAAILGDETGGGALVFANAPTLTGTTNVASLILSDTLTAATTTLATTSVTGPLTVSGDVVVDGVVIDVGTSWAATDGATTNFLNDITFGNGRYVAIESTDEVMYSEDGVNWATSSVPRS